MAITIQINPAGDDPLAEIQSTVRTSRTVNAVITALGDAGEIFSSVTATILENEPNVQIVLGVNSVSIIGTYIDPFSDIFTYVNKGSSNKIETPTTVVGIANVPSNKDLFKLKQDTRDYYLKTYKITVVSDLGTQNFTVTHKILNEWEGIRSFMDSYIIPAPVDNYDTE